MPNETDVLKEFQDRVSDLQLPESACNRFLVARDYDLDKAEDMIRNSERWKKDVNIENVRRSKLPDFIIKDFPYNFTGAGKHGGPVFFAPLGIWKTRYWLDNGKKEQILNFGYGVLEIVLSYMAKMDNKKGILICDMAELTYYKVGSLESLRILYTGFHVIEQNYPETIENIVVINAPWAFSIAYNFLKPLISPNTLNKIQVYGSEKKQWFPVVVQLCTEEAIPQEYLND